MNDPRWDRPDGRRRLARLQRTDHLTGAPRLEHIEHELRSDAARVRHRLWGHVRLLRQLGQLAERPLLARSQIAQGQFVLIFSCDPSPALVQHCQFSTRSVTFFASLMYLAHLPPTFCRSFRDRLPTRWAGLLWCSLLLVAGCATRSSLHQPGSHPFNFGQDTFAYSNGLVWRYDFNPVTGQTVHRRESPGTPYTHHCFVVARS